MRRIITTGVTMGVATVLAVTTGVAGAGAASAAVRPLPDKTYGLSSYYGPRCMPIKGASTRHLGQDMSAKKGTDVKAVAPGTVVKAGATPGFGQVVVIRSNADGGKVFHVYGHVVDGDRYVRSGKYVKRGQHIADVGSSGTSTAPHLHLEIWKGAYKGSGTTTDPLPWMKNHGASLTAGAAWANKRVVPSSCTYYTTTRVNLRSGPGTGYRVIKEVRVNRKLTAKPGASSGVWRKVTRDGVTGWMHADYVSPGLTSLGTRYVEVNGLRLRSTPSTSGRILDTLNRGKAVKKIWPTSNGWVKVYVNGKQGFVAAKYLRR
ncbi:peptidoglycan DD-metalloendopeptidase family protein [Isoptericola sp. 4D.3]|uniref:Peptidoglycan DD-metalloendopeptidase family protein n=1 Tax=Isoptericola peretonis TaxID=2918523 RepID=A0ABT0J4T6_9MICO|nr:peptidoglycan DD-metalloendopeptidase family protein [Isoptericola sp. 4D.3]